jgi:hypothetical protein
MICHEDGQDTRMTVDYHEFVSWDAIAYQFLCFLRAQGYVIPEGETVGADVESYVNSLSKEMD